MIKFNLVPEAALWHKLWSMRLAIASAAFSAAAGAWVILPPDWRPHIPEWGKVALAFVGVSLPAAAAASRVIRQSSLPPKDPPPC